MKAEQNKIYWGLPPSQFFPNRVCLWSNINLLQNCFPQNCTVKLKKIWCITTLFVSNGGKNIHHFDSPSVALIISEEVATFLTSLQHYQQPSVAVQLFIFHFYKSSKIFTLTVFFHALCIYATSDQQQISLNVYHVHPFCSWISFEHFACWGCLGKKRMANRTHTLSPTTPSNGCRGWVLINQEGVPHSYLMKPPVCKVKLVIIIPDRTPIGT